MEQAVYTHKCSCGTESIIKLSHYRGSRITENIENMVNKVHLRRMKKEGWTIDKEGRVICPECTKCSDK